MEQNIEEILNESPNFNIHEDGDKEFKKFELKDIQMENFDLNR